MRNVPGERWWATRALAVCACALVAISAVPLAHWLGTGAHLRPRPSRPYADHALILLAFVPYLIALVVATRARVRARWFLAVGVVAAALLAVVPPLASQDLYSYAIYGRMAARGHNPLAQAPFVLAPDPWLPFVAWRRTAAVYGPVWIGILSAIARVAGDRLWVAVALIKAVTTGAGIAGCVLVARAPGRAGASSRLLAVLWNPLFLFAIAQGGHVDGVVLGLVGVAVATRARGRMNWCTAMLLAATLVKAYCGVLLVVHLVALARACGPRRALAHGAAATAAAGLAYVPLFAGIDTFAGFSDVGVRFSIGLPLELHRALTWVLVRMGALRLSAEDASGVIIHAATVAALGVFVALIARRVWRGRGSMTENMALALGAVFVASPWFLPWYPVPLLGLAVASEEPRARTPRARALRVGAIVLTASSGFRTPLRRWALPLGAAAIARWITRATRGSTPREVATDSAGTSSRPTSASLSTAASSPARVLRLPDTIDDADRERDPLRG